ncbi:MAG: Crp/Fnr family transcriptional regulator [Bacteroidia bacterium]|nr:Crp/Fnr family transcriptional regulator [Bacteroidia bacterium]
MLEPVILPAVLQEFGGRLQQFGRKAPIFAEGQEALHYYQLDYGLVKMANYGAKRERTQKFFFPGESFGEPALLGGFAYPAAAVATEPSGVWLLPRADFYHMLRQAPEAHLRLTRHLCNRLLYKNMLLRGAAEETPEARILALLRYYRRQTAATGAFRVPFTRQEIADMLGLRVETVIRACLELIRNGALQRQDRTLILP